MGRVDEGRALLDRCDDAPGLMRLRGRLRPPHAPADCLTPATATSSQPKLRSNEAVEASAAFANPLDLGRSLLALGSVQRRARKKHAARLTLDRALELFEQLGASAVGGTQPP